MLTREGRRRQVRFRKKTVLYAAGVLACGNIALQALGFVYRVMLSRFAGAEGLGMYRLANSVYLVLHTGCLSGVTMACSRLSAACEATGEKGKTGAVLRLAFSVFFTLAFASAAGLLLCGDQIAAGILGNPHAAQAFPFMLLCLMLTGIENILKALFIGLECVQYTVISETGEQLVRIAAVGVLLHKVGGDCGTMAKLIFAGMAVSEVFSVLLLSLLFRRERGEAHRTAVRVDAALARQFAAIAIPLSLSALAANLLSAAGSVILPRRLMAAGLDAEQALAALGTLSGMVLPLMLLPSALIGSIGTALLPIVTAAHATGNRARVRALVGRAVMTVGLIGIPATAVLIPLAPSLSLLLFAQPLTLRYAALTGAAAVAMYYQMITSGLLNALGLQNRSVLTAVLAEFVQLALVLRWCSRPALGIYGYLLAMLLSGAGAAFFNLAVLHHATGFALRPMRRLGLPLMCGAAAGLWTRLFALLFSEYVASPVLALAMTLAGAGMLCLALLRLCGLHPLRYLAARRE